MTVLERVILHIPHPRFINISGEVYEISTKGGPLKNVRLKRRFIHNGVLGTSGSIGLSEVDAAIEIYEEIKSYYSPTISKTKPVDILAAPASVNPRHDRAFFNGHNKHPPEISDSASARQYSGNGSDVQQ